MYKRQLWDARAALEAARADCTAQEQKLAECRENPMLQQRYKEDEAREDVYKRQVRNTSAMAQAYERGRNV